MVTTSKFGIRKRGTEIGRAIKAAATVAPAAVTLIKTGGSKQPESWFLKNLIYQQERKIEALKKLSAVSPEQLNCVELLSVLQCFQQKKKKNNLSFWLRRNDHTKNVDYLIGISFQSLQDVSHYISILSKRQLSYGGLAENDISSPSLANTTIPLKDQFQDSLLVNSENIPRTEGTISHDLREVDKSFFPVFCLPDGPYSLFHCSQERILSSPFS